MDILNSVWFLRMLKKAGGTPRERLLALFDILADWIDAPHMRDKLSAAEINSAEPQALLEYLTAQASASGAQESETLAQQLYFIAISMLQEEIRTPGCAAGQHARQVAQALIQAQTEKDRFISKRSAYAMTASVFLVTAISSMLVFGFSNPLSATANAANSAAMIKPVAPTKDIEAVAASPEQTAGLYASMEQMRKGQCQYPEALMLPDNQRAIYLENVVSGQVSTKAADQQLVGQIMQKVRCNYTPMLMMNSTG